MEENSGIGGEMKTMWLIIFFVALLFLGIGSCNDNPVDSGKRAKPENHDPIIFSVMVFPDTIGLKDSAIVVCNAMDPDADTLVYDWVTDDRLNIKGAAAFYPHQLYNTWENSRIVFPNFVNSSIETTWLECSARDRHGGMDVKVVQLVVKK
jgi:hypothetical protein